MSIAEDSRLLDEPYQMKVGRPQIFTRIGLAIKNLDYTQLWRRQPLTGIGGSFQAAEALFRRISSSRIRFYREESMSSFSLTIPPLCGL